MKTAKSLFCSPAASFPVCQKENPMKSPEIASSATGQTGGEERRGN